MKEPGTSHYILRIDCEVNFKYAITGKNITFYRFFIGVFFFVKNKVNVLDDEKSSVNELSLTTHNVFHMYCMSISSLVKFRFRQACAK